MGNIMDFWIIEEISRLKNDIIEKQELINKFDLEVREIMATRDISFKDFAILVSKHGNKKMHKAVISCCNKRIQSLKNNTFKSKEEYFRVSIF